MTSLDTVDTFASQLCSRKDGVDEAIRVCLKCPVLYVCYLLQCCYLLNSNLM